MKYFSLRTFPLEGKKVIVRTDYNVPLKGNTIEDTAKIRATLPTIKYLLAKKSTVILMSHLGRPEGRMVPELRTDPLAKELRPFLPSAKVIKLDDCIGKEIRDKINTARPEQIFLLENLRFYKEEEENEIRFAGALAALADVYVNDAFAISHRAHASVQAITKFLPAAAGLLLEKEISNLTQALQPERPAVWIMGGAKLSKIELIQQAMEKADYLLVGGALAFAFLKAKGFPVGMSKTDRASINAARKLLRHKHARKFLLPLDFVVTEHFSPHAMTHTVPYDAIPTTSIALDLGPETLALFKRYLRQAKTVVWNGPLGYYEWAKFATATKEIGRFLGMLTATTIAGGGETADALHKFHLADRLTHVSTGGGAALEFLAGKKLPGIVALEENYKKFRKIVK